MKIKRKLKALIASRRFWAVIIGIGMLLNRDALGLEEGHADSIIALIIAWVIGDSLKTTE